MRLGWVSEKWRIFPKFGKFDQHESHIRTIKLKLVIKNFPHPIKYIFSNIQTKFAKLEIYIYIVTVGVRNKFKRSKLNSKKISSIFQNTIYQIWKTLPSIYIYIYINM